MISLSEAEWEIMKILWEEGNCTLSDIVKKVNLKNIPWAMNTVHTLLSRLEKKKAIKIDKSASPHIYEYIIDKKMCCVFETENFIKRVFDGSLCKMISSLVSSESISEKEMLKLKQLINSDEISNKTKECDDN